MNALDNLAKEVEKETISSMLGQLRSLVEQGILKVKTGEGKFFHKLDSTKIHYGNSIELSIDASDYIKKLELTNDKLIGENKHLKELIKTMSVIAGEV